MKLKSFSAIKTVPLLTGRSMPILGQGTWQMAMDETQKSQEIAAIRTGLDLGMTLIDTAEIYGDGKAEELVAEAIAGRRKEVIIVSKVMPENATKKGTIEACERSLKRLQTEYMDVYLLHWRGALPLEQTLEAFQILKKAGKILDYGVSNFDVSDMEEALSLQGGNQIVTNQVLYNVHARNIEWDLIPWSQEHKIPIMAYTPFGQDAKLIKHPTMISIASRHNATPAQILLTWILRQKNMVVIPKASSSEHVVQNRAALEIKLTVEDLNEIDRSFPPPKKKKALEVI